MIELEKVDRYLFRVHFWSVIMLLASIALLFIYVFEGGTANRFSIYACCSCIIFCIGFNYVYFSFRERKKWAHKILYGFCLLLILLMLGLIGTGILNLIFIVPALFANFFILPGIIRLTILLKSEQVKESYRESLK